MADSADLKIIISARNLAQRDLDDIKRSLGGLESGAKDAGRGFDEFSRKLVGIGAGIYVFREMADLAGRVGETMLGPIRAASDLNETVNKAKVVFGTAADSVLAFGETSAQAMGQSRQQAIEAAATYGNLFVTMGIGRQAAAEMSMSMVKLAADIASFNNIPMDVALEKIRSGLVGEVEPLRQVGVLLSEEQVKLKAVQMGLTDNADALTEAQKVQARYALILEQTAVQQGDFARTSTGLANSTRIIQASFADLQAEIGNELLPVIAPLVSNFAQSLPGALSTAKGYLDTAGAAVLTASDLLGDLRARADDAAKEIASVGERAGEVVQPVWDTARGVAASAAAMGILETTAKAAAVALSAKLVVDMANAAATAATLARTATQAALAIGAVAVVAGAMTGGAVLAAAGTGIAITAAEVWRRAGEAIEEVKKQIGATLDDITAGLDEVGAKFEANRIRLSGPVRTQLPDTAEAARAVARGLEDADAAAKRASQSMAVAGKKGAEDLKRAADQARDLADQMTDVARKAQVELIQIGERHGEAIIEATVQWQRAIEDARRSAAESLQELESREILDASVAARRKALEDRLAAEKRVHEEQVEDQELIYQRDRELRKAKTDEERRQILERYAEQVEETQHRRELARQEAEFEKQQEAERAALERELHDEELNRQRARIQQQLQESIAAANAEFADRKAKADQQAKEDIERVAMTAAASLQEMKQRFFDKLPDAAKAGAADLAKLLDDTIGNSVRAIWDTVAKVQAATGLGGGSSGGGAAAGGGAGESGGGYWSNGEYIDPRHQPGGDIFEMWKRNEPEQYREWAEEHGVALQSGGIVTRPTLALIGEAGPEAVVPLNRAQRVTGGPLVGQLVIQSPEPISPASYRRQTERMLRSLVMEYGL